MVSLQQGRRFPPADHEFQALLARVQAVQKDVDKLVSGNETLQMYIDNLTLQIAKRR